MNLEQIYQKLQNLTNTKITQADLGRALGVDRSSINIRLKRNGELKLSEIEKLSKYFRIDLSDLTGISTNCYTNETTVPVLGEVYASMGNGITVYNESQTGTYAISNQLAKELGVSLNNAVMIFASGDSMKPTIFGGDSLLVDTSKTSIYDGRIYCVRIDGQLYAKRLQKIPPDRIKVVSDNQEKYDAFYVDKDSTFDFEVIGEIRWWGRVAR